MEAGGRIHLFDADGRQADLRLIRSQVSQISVKFFEAAMIDTRLLKNWIGDRVGKEPGSGVQLSGGIRSGPAALSTGSPDRAPIRPPAE
jgi:hypothetical protein